MAKLTVTDIADEILKVFDLPLILAFKYEGWVWGGSWVGSSIDSMHVQAANVM